MRVLLTIGLSLFTAAAAAMELQFTPVSGRTGIVDIRHAGDGSGRLFLVGQPGRVWILRNGAVSPNPFVDLRDRVNAGGERGLLSLAFAPDYASTGRVYTYYTNQQDDMVLSRWLRSADPDAIDPGSEEILLTIGQPDTNHNGGRLAFGPDGMLYLSIGDGGGAGDPGNNAQNRANLLGTIVRLDVSGPGNPAIPPDNPYVGHAVFREEIWAWGLRNPWRIAFDRDTGALYIADVGQNSREEVNVQAAASTGGENYGWRIMEGTRCFNPSPCDTSGLVLPVAEYSHDQGCSITGGEVYRGSVHPSLDGVYLYGDFCSGRLWGLSHDGNDWSVDFLADTGFRLLSFGADESGELYLSDAASGVYRIGVEAPDPDPPILINAAMNDAWYDPRQAGQGVFITVLPGLGKVFLAWFTFEAGPVDSAAEAVVGAPEHRWLTALGDYVDNTALLEIEVTSGGLFDAGEPKPQQVPGGTISLVFEGCNGLILDYDMPGIGLQGRVTLQRIAVDNVPLCLELGDPDP